MAVFLKLIQPGRVFRDVGISMEIPTRSSLGGGEEQAVAHTRIIPSILGQRAGPASPGKLYTQGRRIRMHFWNRGP